MSRIAGVTRAVAGGIAALLIAMGLPAGWVWVGSQVQGGTEPRAAAILTVIGGLIGSYAVVATLAGSLQRRRRAPRRYAWNRSLRSARTTPAETTWAERVAIAATLVAAVICSVWFFMFGNPGIPGA